MPDIKEEEINETPELSADSDANSWGGKPYQAPQDQIEEEKVPWDGLPEEEKV